MAKSLEIYIQICNGLLKRCNQMLLLHLSFPQHNEQIPFVHVQKEYNTHIWFYNIPSFGYPGIGTLKLRVTKPHNSVASKLMLTFLADLEYQKMAPARTRKREENTRTILMITKKIRLK